ncbi:hypothetical protein CFP65_6940 [Kitasatospora sp. MMS16-BH015]|uniref:C40 family peptidase n=1 Tax=Kitasatospora sp. MMS16-BH015 TaxID=2018025 RepID=UPI000CA344AE|nr:NlpC/P60 family protein [Kitasatospora sp. MMS16-BH015]AUG81557.1 hypothetical protein CFP65_6940 [Kitasatospora sp. MMS16-BH015]
MRWKPGRSTGQGSTDRRWPGVLLIAVLCCGLAAGPAWADPDEDTGAAPATVLGETEDVAKLLVRVQALRHAEEQAQQAALAREGELKARQADLVSATRLVDAQQLRVDAGEAAAAQLASEQYRGGPSAFARLLLTDGPAELLAQARDLAVRGRTAAHIIQDLRDARAELGRLQSAAQQASDQALGLARAAGTARELAQNQVAQAEAELAKITSDQLAQLERRETALAERDQQQLLAAGRLGQGDATATPAAQAAIDFALGQLGKPYVWGAVGPDSFDCSGLTSKAWAAAGVAIPRTSEEQWAHLPKVRLSELQPGDLVIYFAEATHVSMYLGHGLMVHAPHTGTVVKVAPVAAMPILGAVRPPAPAPTGDLPVPVAG